MSPNAEDFCFVYVTAPNRVEAERLARHGVETRLAACANILGDIQSFYWWDDAVQDEAECALIFKTRNDLFDRLRAAIADIHSYECPCIVALPLIHGSAGYLGWLEAQTAP